MYRAVGYEQGTGKEAKDLGYRGITVMGFFISSRDLEA